MIVIIPEYLIIKIIHQVILVYYLLAASISLLIKHPYCGKHINCKVSHARDIDQWL